MDPCGQGRPPVLAGEGFYQLMEIKDYGGVASIYALVIAGLSLLLGGILYVKFLKAEYLEVKT